MRDDSAPASLEFERCGWRLHLLLARRFVLLRPTTQGSLSRAHYMRNWTPQLPAISAKTHTHALWVRESEILDPSPRAGSAHVRERSSTSISSRSRMNFFGEKSCECERQVMNESAPLHHRLRVNYSDCFLHSWFQLPPQRIEIFWNGYAHQIGS